MVKKAKKKNDAVMTGILVTKFQMGLITVEDLGEMAKDITGSERASAAKKCWQRLKILPDLSCGNALSSYQIL